MQLWSSAGLSQTIKWLTPFGWVSERDPNEDFLQLYWEKFTSMFSLQIWSPILPDLIHAISFVESRAIKDVAYYKVTTRFVNDVLGECTL